MRSSYSRIENTWKKKKIKKIKPKSLVLSGVLTKFGKPIVH